MAVQQTSLKDRRAFLHAAAAAFLGSLGMARRSVAAQPRASDQSTVITLRERVSLLTSGGTNVVALSTTDGLVLVDSGDPALSDPLIAALQRLSGADGVRTVFNTHWHLENTGANERLHRAGATIVAHENTRLWMSTPTWMPAEDRYRAPRPKLALPDDTFRVDRSMTVGPERIECAYLIEAHTSGDISVFFRDSNVLAVGDVASPVRDPELDYLTGAWIGGRVDAMDRLLALSNADTIIVPGFGPAITRAALQIERDVMKTIYDRTVDLARQGLGADDMLKAGGMDGLARTWKDPKKFLYDVQKGLWAHHNKLAPNVV